MLSISSGVENYKGEVIGAASNIICIFLIQRNILIHDISRIFFCLPKELRCHMNPIGSRELEPFGGRGVVSLNAVYKFLKVLNAAGEDLCGYPVEQQHHLDFWGHRPGAIAISCISRDRVWGSKVSPTYD